MTKTLRVWGAPLTKAPQSKNQKGFMKPQWSDLNKLNLCPRLSPHLPNHRIDLVSQKLVPINPPGINWNVPWHYINDDPKRAGHCRRLLVLFKALNFKPSFCRDSCWKVVVNPRTLRELYQLRDIQLDMVKTDPECWCKCGIEMRPTNGGVLYGGYFYANSKEEGLDRWHAVRGLVPKEIRVVLKRHCTEMELKLGDPERYISPPHAKEQEEMYFNMMDTTDLDDHSQPKWALLQVEQNWISFGWKYGSPEDRQQIEDDHNNGEPLYPACRTYHPGD